MKHFLILLLSFLTVTAYAVEGNFDSTFGNNGKVNVAFDLAGTSFTDAAVTTLSINAGNPTAVRFLSVGRTFDSTGKVRLAIVALRNDGVPDSSFFSTGARIDRTTLLFDIRKAILVNNKIVVMGYYQNPSTNNADFGLQRFNLDGSADLNFGALSLAIAAFNRGGSNNDFPNALVADASGNIYVAGSVARSIAGDFDFGIAKFDANGIPVTAFGNQGMVVHPFDIGGPADDSARALAVEANVLWVAGNATVMNQGNRVDMAMLRLSPVTGDLDAFFCANQNSACSDSLITTPGKRTLTLLGQGWSASAEFILSSFNGGAVHVGGTVRAPTAGDPLARIGMIQRMLGGGTIDVSYGSVNAAYSTSLLSRTDLYDAVSFNGKITLVGETSGVSGGSVGFVTRLDGQGSPDTSFVTANGPSATQLITFPAAAGTTESTRLRDIRIVDTQVVLSGDRLWQNNDTDFAIVRLKGSKLLRDGFE